MGSQNMQGQIPQALLNRIHQGGEGSGSVTGHRPVGTGDPLLSTPPAAMPNSRAAMRAVTAHPGGQETGGGDMQGFVKALMAMLQARGPSNPGG